MKTLRLLLLLPLALPASRLAAQTEYFSNLNLSTYNGTYVTNDQWIARSFTTGAEVAGYDLDYLNMEIGFSSDPTFAVELWSDNTGIPGSSLMDFNHVGGTEFDPVSGVTLAPSTTYWVVVSSTQSFSASTNYTWFFPESSSFDALDGWTVGGPAPLSDDQGSSWSTNVYHSYKFAVTATALATVPEPATYALLAGLGVLLLAAWRRRAATA